MVPVSWHVHVRWHNCRLHPLIHTLLEFNVAQSVAHSLCEIASGFVERVGGEAGKVVIK